MSHSESRISPEEIARRGDEIYERDLRAKLEPDQVGMIVAIDINTGQHSVAETSLATSRDLRSRQPDAVVWLVRIGHRALHRLGIGSRRGGS
jgi:hypothetical protein